MKKSANSFDSKNEIVRKSKSGKLETNINKTEEMAWVMSWTK
jgi:hypothetical protein